MSAENKYYECDDLQYEDVDDFPTFPFPTFPVEDMPTNELNLLEVEILRVLDTYLTIVKYLLRKPAGVREKLKKNVKKIKKVREALLRQDGSIKKYLDKDGYYYDRL